MLTDPETLKMATSSFEFKKGTVQAATGSIDGIPTFPHTKVPIMLPNLWWQGLSSQEGLHEHEGHDPVIVAKVPKLMRYQPPPTVQCPIGTRWLRSTWFLCGGAWEKVEGRVEPALQWERIDKYVERAVWQFHPILPAAPARQVIQPRQHFGQDASFQLFMQEVDGTDIIDTTINSLPARLLRCFKTMMRRTRIIVNKTIIVSLSHTESQFAIICDLLIRRQTSHFALSITMVPYLACLATLMYMVWLLAQRSPSLHWTPTNRRWSWHVRNRTTGSLRLLYAGKYRLLRLPFRMTCSSSTGRTSPSTPLPNRATFFLLDPAREDHHGRD